MMMLTACPAVAIAAQLRVARDLCGLKQVEGRQMVAQMGRTQPRLGGPDLGGQRGGYGYTTKIPMKDLAPGTYVLKVEAKSRLANVAAASREVLIKVEPARGAGR